MLPASTRHKCSGTDLSAHQCSARVNCRQSNVHVVQQLRHQQPVLMACGELLAPVRAQQQVDWECSQPSRCSPVACSSYGNDGDWCHPANSGVLRHCVSQTRPFPAHSRTRHRLQHSSTLGVVALDRDGHSSEDIEEYEQPPEAGKAMQCYVNGM